MPEWIAAVAAFLIPYWPFIVKLVTFWFVTQNLKKRVFTKHRALRSEAFAFMRATMWAHPMVAGFLWGMLFPWMPAVDFITTRGGAITEGILAGVVSVVAFVILDRLAEARGWVWVHKAMHDVGEDRISSIPPPPPRLV